jgi:hypothetical protein
MADNGNPQRPALENLARESTEYRKIAHLCGHKDRAEVSPAAGKQLDSDAFRAAAGSTV